MWSKVRNGFVAGVVGVSLLAGCAIHDDKTSDYNALVEKYNTLMTASHAVQVQSQKEEKELQELDDLLGEFTKTAKALRSSFAWLSDITDPAQADVPLRNAEEIDALTLQINTRIARLEQVILAEMSALYDNAGYVYKYTVTNQSEIQSERNRLTKKTRVLQGLWNLVNDDRLALIAETSTRLKMASARAKMPLPNVGTKVPEIKLSKRDEEVKLNVTGRSGGFTRDSRNQIQSFDTVHSAIAYASQNGFSTAAAEDAYKLAAQTRGMMSFSRGQKELPVAINDMVSHFKPQMNFNSDDLELAFVIDYSASMSDDIEAVIKGLLDIVKEMENVKAAGRTVKIGIVTFGEQGKEKVNLDLTSNLNHVNDTLRQLLADYRSNQHSTDPGEASYHGMALAAEKLSWRSKNRMSVAITDEESYEVHTGQQSFVNETIKKLSDRGIQNHIYTIVVSR